MRFRLPSTRTLPHLPPPDLSPHPALPRRHSPTSSPLSPRWLSDVQTRIGKCITWGLTRAQLVEAGAILQEIARDWRALVAGSQGFLTDPRRCGLWRQKVVWGEMDSMGHVNNVVYNRFAESSRVAWMHQIAVHVDPTHARAWSGLWKPEREGLLLRSIATQFKFPLSFPDHVTVFHRLAHKPAPGTDFITSHVLILSERHRRIAARCVEENVLYDYHAGTRVPFQPFMLDVLVQTYEAQEEAREVNARRVRVLLDRVRDLEKESWDREGAVEDLGSA